MFCAPFLIGNKIVISNADQPPCMTPVNHHLKADLLSVKVYATMKYIISRHLFIYLFQTTQYA